MTSELAHTVFTRLNCTSTTAILKELWDRRLIALHYGNNASADPEKYEGEGKNALSRLQRYCREGALVAADFRRLYRDRFLIGEIQPGTEVKVETFVGDKGAELKYKLTQLTNVKEVRYADYPVLLAIQPRQSTLTGWQSAKRVLYSAYNASPLPIQVESLSPDQLEVVCYEYLKERGLISRLLMPIGRGLVDVDIMGLNNLNQPVLAQVTQSRSKSVNNEKLTKLLAHRTDDSSVYYFGHSASAPETGEFSFFDVNDAFLESLDDKLSRAMVLRMLNHPVSNEED